MKYRKLRIAWSVACGVACLLVIVLWVRSYWRWDRVAGTSFGKHFAISSIRGTINGSYYVTGSAIEWYWNSFTNLQVTDDPKLIRADGTNHPVGFGWYAGPLGFRIYDQSISLPLWSFVMLFLTLGATPWWRQLPYQFSLRTLLVAMTLVAVGLGVIVYAMR